MNKIISLLALLSLVITNSLAIDEDDISFNGYGTIGVAYQDNEDVLYRNSLNTKRGTKGDLSFNNYSSLGLQLDVKVTDYLSLTAQGIASATNEDYLELGWLNAKYQLSDDSSVRIGKMRLPAFMYSDILNVSYSYDWVRLPDMYSVIPLNNYTGIEFNHNIEFNDFNIMATALYGESKSSLYSSSTQGIVSKEDISADKVYGLSFKLLSDNFTLRMGYSEFLFTLSSKDLDRAFTQLNSLGIPSISQTIDEYQIKNTSVKYLDIAARYDFENTYLLAEYMKFTNKSFLSNHTSWYIGTGYNFENWSPFVLYSKVDGSKSYNAPPVQEGMPIGLIAANQGLSDISDSMMNIELETLSLGFRYNLSENSILKLQYDRQKEMKKNRLNFHYSEDKEVDLDIFSATVSFVF